MPSSGYKKRRTHWTREACVEAVKEWNERHGDFPAATDWNPGDSQRSAVRSAERAQAWSIRAQRFYDGEYPWTGTVWRLFGSWNALIKEAGFKPRPPRRSLLDLGNRADVDRLVELAGEIDKLEGDRRRVALHELASVALTMAMDEMEVSDEADDKQAGNGRRAAAATA